MFKTIRLQLLSILLLFASITAIISIIVFNYFIKSKDALSQITQKIETTYILLLEDVKVTHDIFENETINPKFFETGKSRLLDEHFSICSRIKSSLTNLDHLQKQKGYEIGPEIRKFSADFETYKTQTDKIIKLILIRGFKDYGIEGKMRSYAHELEEYRHEIGLVSILQLRRHEKDFIARQEEQYLLKFRSLIADIKQELGADRSISDERKLSGLNALNSYSRLFEDLALHEKKIGLKSGSGMKKEIDLTTAGMEKMFRSILKTAAVKEKQSLMQIRILFFLVWFVFIILSIGAAIWISKRSSAKITELEKKITEFVKSDFTVRTILPIRNSGHEVDVLATNFSIMEQHIVNQMTALKQTNKELEMLFYRASHDIKTPLSTVKGLTNIARRELSDEKALDYLSMIDRCWNNLNTIVDELGMVTDIKGEEIVAGSIDFEEIIHSVLNELRPMPAFEHVVFSFDITLKEEFCSSYPLIKTIFRHLLENAIKYSTKRNSFSFVKVSVQRSKENMVQIVVADNGIGIQKEYHTKIFDMFFRGTTHASGTGLGLFIVQNSLQKLNGAINVESDEEWGTTFTILLPDKSSNNNIMERILQKKAVVDSSAHMVLNYI
ncbi:MAG: sensor histidine kinase [Bacteroidia bacterium]